MAAPARPLQPDHIELSVAEARTRFLQLMQLMRLTRPTIVIVDNGRPLAAIVAPDSLISDPAQQALSTNASAAGWMQRLERVRQDVRRQHAAETEELLQALNEAWKIVDELRPTGADRRVDAVRVTHQHLRHQATAGDSGRPSDIRSPWPSDLDAQRRAT